MFKYEFIANVSLSLPVKKIRKSVNIWRSYGQEFSVLFFIDSVYEYISVHCVHGVQRCGLLLQTWRGLCVEHNHELG